MNVTISREYIRKIKQTIGKSFALRKQILITSKPNEEVTVETEQVSLCANCYEEHSGTREVDNWIACSR